MTVEGQQVIDLLVAEWGIKRKRVDLYSTLQNDLGVEGDDAVEFFEAFQTKFNVDLDNLYSHWDEHFWPEGIQISFGAFAITTLAGVFAGDCLHHWFPWLPMWAATLAAIVFFAWIFLTVYRRTVVVEVKIPITLGDLARAVESGRWPLEYPPADTLFRVLY